MPILHNPERHWERPAQTVTVSRDDVEKRLGRLSENFEALSGGMANANVRVGTDKVLRIYRQDAGRLGLERALLSRPWQALVVPQVLEAGPDHLLLSYVPHEPIQDCAEHGSAVGRALAEIHATTFASAGFLGADLKVSEAFPDLVTSLIDFARSCLEAAAPRFDDLKQPVLDHFKVNAEAMRQAAGQPVLLHSDFKVSNVHWTASSLPLVLDWETAYAGSALSDIGQLFRWRPSDAFAATFAAAYRAAGRPLAEAWRRSAEAFDLVNLVSLLKDAEKGSRRGKDVAARVRQTLSAGSI